ncbi:MAG: hypothetical protein HY904_25245 [Deltaproteobacteria bacterium]|nr:hypothetical protein [Deltaproteobacteria bacterium]
MPVQISEAQALVLRQLKPVESADALQELLARLREPLATLVTEVMEPDQSVEATRLEVVDLFLMINDHESDLARVQFGPAERSRFRDTIVALLTVNGLFSNQLRLGDWKAQTVDQAIRASMPWRNKLRLKASQVFFFDATKLGTYQDHNESGTIEEECADLRALVMAARSDQAQLGAVGFTDADIHEGERLLTAAEGRDVLALIGVRSQAEMKQLRDRLLTLAVLLARHARACGMSAYWNDPATAQKFERVSFRSALRRLRPTRTRADGETPEPPVTAPMNTPPTG